MRPQLPNRQWRLRVALLVFGCNAVALGQEQTTPSQYGDWNIGHNVIHATPDSGAHRQMDIHVWFPTSADVSTLEPASYGKNTARFALETDQAVSDQSFPLIVYSPGWGSEATTKIPICGHQGVGSCDPVLTGSRYFALATQRT